jgi:hypothetical protein
VKAEGEKPTERPSLEADIKKQVKDAGGIHSWLGNATGEVWLVRGKPWREVCAVVSGRSILEYSLGHETICRKDDQSSFRGSGYLSGMVTRFSYSC